jgi:rhodanese-related sulfurtransferase
VTSTPTTHGLGDPADPTARPATVDALELRDWLASGTAPRVLDVRTPAEFESMHVPGSYNVPLDTLREHRDELHRHLDDDVVLVCRSGGRAAQAEQALAEVGMPNVHVLDGGILAWSRLVGEVNRGRQRWDIERQVRLVAGSLVLTGVLGSVAAPRLKWLSGAVGGGLAFAALSNSCLMGTALSKLPYNRGAGGCDIGEVIAELSADRATDDR